MKLIFFFKMHQILCTFQKCEKNSTKHFWIWKQWRLNLLQELISIMTRIHVIGSQISDLTKQDVS